MRAHLTFRWLPAVAVMVCVASVDLLAQPNRDAALRATATFLDKTRPDSERLDAATRFGYPDDETIPRLLALGADRTQSDAVRFEALRRVRFGPAYLEVVLKILDSSTDGGEELDANLISDISKRMTFKPPAEMLRQVTTVLRKLLRDRREKVRLYSYRALVANHDSVAINLLADSLRRGRNFPVPPAEAIDLLDQDGPANHIGAIRPYLSNSDPKVQGRAARALALDPQSRARIIELATSGTTAEEVRLHALRALAREDEKFGSYAIPLVENAAEDGDVRHAAMHAYAGHLNYRRVAAAEQIRFAEAVEKLGGEGRLLGTPESAAIKSSAKELLEYLKQAFPDIKRHYAGR